MSSSKVINVLVFPAGEINSIELHDALCSCVNVKLFGASSIDRHGKYVFENYTSGLPMIKDPDFFEKFNSYLEKNKIDLIFPTHDTVAEFFAENNGKLKARTIVADKKTSEICRDKSKTFDVFKNETFCPKIYDKITDYPVFIKPKEGQGSIGAKLIKKEADLPKDINLKDYVVCEYLPKKEYTIDCLTDKDGNLVFVSPRSRDRLMAGVCVSGKTEPLTDEIKNIALKINKKLNFKGLWWFQIKQDVKNKWKLLEISTRCAGTMCLTRARGVNLALLSVYIFMGYDISATPNPYKIKMDRTLISRYKIDYKYDTVYFDYDDTLIVREKVNLNAIRFLYQCQNEAKKIVLLTKHEDELEKSLEKYAISKDLFKEIIHIKKDEEKTDFINPKCAIFVDNAHKERQKVQEKFNIPVFDVDTLEVLLDWKC